MRNLRAFLATARDVGLELADLLGCLFVIALFASATSLVLS